MHYVSLSLNVLTIPRDLVTLDLMYCWCFSVGQFLSIMNEWYYTLHSYLSLIPMLYSNTYDDQDVRFYKLYKI